MTEAQKSFEAWFKTTNQTLAMKGWSYRCYQKAWQHQQRRIDDQLLTIKALNECINGKDSLTTDNLTLVGRFEQRIERLNLIIKTIKRSIEVFAKHEKFNQSQKDALNSVLYAIKEIEAIS